MSRFAPKITYWIKNTFLNKKPRFFCKRARNIGEVSQKNKSPLSSCLLFYPVNFRMIFFMNFLWKSLPANVTSKWFIIWMSDKMGFPVASIFDVHLLAAKATEKSYSAVWVIPIIVHMQSVTRTTRFWINWCEFTLRQEGRWFIFSHGKKVREVRFKKVHRGNNNFTNYTSGQFWKQLKNSNNKNNTYYYLKTIRLKK